MNSTRVMCLALILSAGVACHPWQAWATDAADKLMTMVEAAGHDIPSKANLRSACDNDTGCIARFLKGRIGAGAEIVPQDQSLAKRGSWSDLRPAVEAETLDGGKLKLSFRRFDVQAVRQSVEKSVPVPTNVIIDIRHMTHPEDVAGMRSVAALFMTPESRAFQVAHNSGRIVSWAVPNVKSPFRKASIEVWIGPETSKAAEVFAHLLRNASNAEIFGEISAGDPHLQKSFDLGSGWVFLVPTAELVIHGRELSDGITPDGPIN